ncbi:MAG TPA: tetratricopeptide repeat protein [Terriglobales bacterium]|jgi:tetratricopeptide (TPR) repeat protein
MVRSLVLSVILGFGGALAVYGQTPVNQDSSQQTSGNSEHSGTVRAAGSSSGESSSKNTQVDISPPPDDAKDHPDSAGAISDAEEESGANSSQVEEFHPWNPHKAMKDIEVGDFYFRQNNYKAALSRYQEALLYKPNDAVANFRSAQCFEKLNSPQDAVEHYQAYLKVMPHGPLSRDAEKALAKLQGAPTNAPRKSQ